MKTVGIIAEYNPFHNGHLYHIEKAKELTGSDHAVVVMSGDFLQRGIPAVTDKYTRTRMALACGADMVFELPVRYACGSAEYFAAGSAALLEQLPFVDCLCFGSECDDISLLSSIADVLLEEPEPFRRIIKEKQKEGLSYPAAWNYAAAACLPLSPALDTILATPNNILGIEYIKALKKINSRIRPYCLARKDAGYHDPRLNPSGEGTAVISSATAIRNAYRTERSVQSLRSSMPAMSYQILKEAEGFRFPLDEDDLSAFLFYRLSELAGQDLSIYHDVSCDLSCRIHHLLGEYTTFKEFAKLLKTKQYTLTRINRSLIHILLNIRHFAITNSACNKTIPYLRLLGLNKDASFYIKNSLFHPPVPLITKTAGAKERICPDGFLLFQEDIYASSLYNYCIYQKYRCKVPDDYRMSPVIL